MYSFLVLNYPILQAHIPLIVQDFDYVFEITNPILFCYMYKIMIRKGLMIYFG